MTGLVERESNFRMKSRGNLTFMNFIQIGTRPACWKGAVEAGVGPHLLNRHSTFRAVLLLGTFFVARPPPNEYVRRILDSNLQRTGRMNHPMRYLTLAILTLTVQRNSQLRTCLTKAMLQVNKELLRVGYRDSLADR